MNKSLGEFQDYLNSIVEYTISLTEDELYYLSDLMAGYLDSNEEDPIIASIYDKLQEELDPYGVANNE